jgi:hypothetical protein
MLRLIEELAMDWHRLDERIDGLSAEIEALRPSRHTIPKIVEGSTPLPVKEG